MPTTYQAIYLGKSNLVLDPTEGNSNNEGYRAFQNQTFGSVGSPLYGSKVSITVGNFAGGSAANALETNNSDENATMTTTIGGVSQTLIYDGNSIYNITLTYADGTTAAVTGVIAQTTTGELFLMPEITGSNDGDTARYEAKPIVSITTGQAVTYNNVNLGADRIVTAYDDGFIDGTTGNDLIDASYVEPITSGSDRVDNGDAALPAGAALVTSANSNDDKIRAGDGNDTVLSGLGADWVDAGLGNDSVLGGAGNDTLLGGLGNDTLLGEAGADSLSGGDGDDSLSGGADNDTLLGGAGADLLAGGTGNDLIDGGADSDQIQIGASEGADTIAGGDTGIDSDFLSFSGAGVNVAFTGAEAGTYTIGSGTGSFTGIEGIWGSAFADTIDGGANQAAMTVKGYDGDDRIIGGTAADFLEGGAGADTVSGGLGNDTVTGGDGNDLLDGGEGADWVFGDAGNDTLIGGAGDDYLTDSNGDDLHLAGDGNDTINDNYGNDTIDAGAGNDRVNAGEGNDLVDGGSGDDSLLGGIGNDTMVGGAGADTLSGGAGIDRLDYTASDAGILIDLVTGSASGGHATGDVISPDFEEALGSDHADLISAANGMSEATGGGYLLDGRGGDDTLIGGLGTDTLLGGDGADSLAGGDGNDSLVGGAGDDTLRGGAGADSLQGGAGMDYIDYSGSDAGVTINLETSQASGGHADGDVLQGGIDGIIGSDFADVLTGYNSQGTDPGDPWTNIFYGNGGNDLLSGMGGDDQLHGGADQDTLLGGLGNDSLYGDAGHDSLDGGAGDDSLDGGQGNDILAGGNGSDTLTGGDGDDTLIADGGADTLVGGADADTLVLGAGATDGTVIDGSNGGYDQDTLDLRAWGKANTEIIFDPDNRENGEVRLLDAAGNVTGIVTFTDIENIIPCFTPGSLIVTACGERPVERLVPGDRVLTRDHGWQEVRWVGRRDLTAANLTVRPDLRPVLIRQGALGCGLPARDMLVSPQHRMLITGPRAEMLFGEHEVLVAAVHLLELPGVELTPAAPVSYIHLLCDRHEIIRADGAWTETFQPGDMSLRGMDAPQRREVLALFPELAQGMPYPGARLTLKRHEARVLLSA